ncbi:ABC transporter ATP-binding protein [Falsiroseomonas oryziterrae]|uniref:ABC transporter ATP-binding protein n=1 Tax=Falsiroseomonas oryziterrae TaxID=2911368 RepID=UPI001F1D2C3E|nr:ABC transporter ATP-binding protein [Roseomonas sp. NPKOSM-4]
MTAPLLRFERVSKSYPATRGQTTPAALEALDLDVMRGELLTLLGPSGSGKTTTLMLLAGFELPDSGRILLEDRDIAQLPPHKRGIGVVFQSYALFPHMTVADNVAFPLEARGVPKAERAARVQRALEMVRLPGYGDRRPSQLSGGQQQRVALARAMVFEPPIVLLDEPLGALDKALREEMQHEIRALHQRLGLTMLYVTHDQSEALTLSDRIAVLSRGRLRQLSTPRALYEEPADAFVAGFVGENNRIAVGVLEIAHGKARVKLQEGVEVLARLGEAVTPESYAVLTIRPERVAVVDAAGEGMLRARLAEVLFQGDHFRLRLLLPGGAEIVAKRAVGAEPPPEPGTEVGVTWWPDDALVFRDEADTV